MHSFGMVFQQLGGKDAALLTSWEDGTNNLPFARRGTSLRNIGKMRFAGGHMTGHMHLFWNRKHSHEEEVKIWCHVRALQGRAEASFGWNVEEGLRRNASWEWDVSFSWFWLRRSYLV